MWAPRMMIIEPQSCKHSITVSFTAPPKGFRFKFVKVEVYTNEIASGYISQVRIELHSDKMISVTFKNIATNAELLHVGIKPDHYADGKCKKYADNGNSDSTGGYTLTSGHCHLFESFHFKWTNKHCNLPHFRYEPSTKALISNTSNFTNLKRSDVIWVAMVALLGPIIMVVFGVFIYKKLFHKTIVIIYDKWDSTTPHNRAVNALLQVIKKSGGKVHTLNMFQPKRPNISTRDVVIFINSKGITSNFARFQEQEDGKTPPVLIHIKHHSNIQCARFEYTESNLSIPVLSESDSNFSRNALCLPGDLNELIKELGMKPDKLKMEHLPEMEDLKQAVRDMIAQLETESSLAARDVFAGNRIANWPRVSGNRAADGNVYNTGMYADGCDFDSRNLPTSRAESINGLIFGSGTDDANWNRNGNRRINGNGAINGNGNFNGHGTVSGRVDDSGFQTGSGPETENLLCGYENDRRSVTSADPTILSYPPM